MSRLPSFPFTPGVFIFDDQSLVFIDDIARRQTGCPADASLPECRRIIAPVMDAVRAHPSDTVAVDLHADGADALSAAESGGDAARRVQASADRSNGMQVVRVWTESDAQRAHRLEADDAFHQDVQPVYRAFAHDARNPIVASQLQLGILRELDAETVSDRSRSIADTLERHMESMSDGISLLINELAPASDTSPTDVLVAMDQVRRLVLPYAKRKSVAVEARTDAAEVFTSAPTRGLKRAVLGYLARLLAHATPGDQVELHVDPAASNPADSETAASESAPEITEAAPRGTEAAPWGTEAVPQITEAMPRITITAPGLVSTSERSRSAARLLRLDADRMNAHVRVESADGGTRVQLTLPPARD